MDEASAQIYGGFSFTAPVIHGDARGRELGFPTANQEYPKDMLDLKFGVYISRVTVDGKQPFEIRDDIICLHDFEGNYYEIDFDGKSLR